jgi:hypothetical protein
LPSLSGIMSLQGVSLNVMRDINKCFCVYMVVVLVWYVAKDHSYCIVVGEIGFRPNTLL